MPSAVTFDEVLASAVQYFIQYGYQNEEALTYWSTRLAEAARRSMISITQMNEKVRAALTAEYTRLVERGLAISKHPEIAKSTLAKIRPELRRVLSDRIAASALLIRLNREEAIASTVRRFAGWASSLPPTPQVGTPAREVRASIRKGLAAASFQERRLLIDQGHKLNANINATIAEGGGAIAAIWISHYSQHNYDFRESHKDLDLESHKRPFLIRNSWAHKAGLLSTVNATFTDELEYQPGQQPYCRCYFLYIYSLSKLPKDMLTRKAA